MLLTGANIPITELASTTPIRLRLLKTLLTTPWIAFVPIFPEEVIDEFDAEISTQLVVSTVDGGKEFVSDNTAPKPRTWNVKGYIKGIPYIELTSWFMPSLSAQKLIIDSAIRLRRPLPFRTSEGEIVKVLVKNRKYISTPDNMNTLKIELLVQEFLQFNIDALVNGAVASEVAKQSIPQLGTLMGAAVQFGGAVIAATVEGAAVLLSEKEDSYMQKRRPGAIERYTMPSGDTTLARFALSANTELGTIDFEFYYIEDQWHVDYNLVKPVVGEVSGLRTGVVRPNVIQLPDAPDYSIRFVTEADTITQSNIWLVVLEVLIW